MIILRRHDSQDYAMLPDIDAPGVGALTADDRHCLDELGDYIVRAEAHERFGATLLHRHFPVARDETFVEEADLTAKQLMLRPVRDAASDLAAVNVRFEPATSDGVQLVGLEFASPEILGDVDPINEADIHLLAGVGDILDRCGKSTRFGLRLFHDPLKADGRVLLESCDPVERVLTCTVAGSDDPRYARSIPTVFRWERKIRKDGDGLTVSQECEVRCITHQFCVTGYGGAHTQHEEHVHPEEGHTRT